MFPDLIILNGNLITFDEARASADALAISGETIMAVGDEAEIRALAGPNTRLVDAAGHTVLPKADLFSPYRTGATG